MMLIYENNLSQPNPFCSVKSAITAIVMGITLPVGHAVCLT